MDCGVVEFHTLADADGTGAQDDDLLPVRDLGFVFLGIGGVEIGHIAVKLAGAGVNHLVHREQVFLAAGVINLLLRGAPQGGNPPVGEAHGLGLPQVGQTSGVFFQLLFKACDVFQLAQEENADGGGIADSGRVHPPEQKLSQGIEPVRGTLGGVV